MKKQKKPELLAPAGSFEKLKTAVHFGADAVYMAGKQFSLRNFATNFTNNELKEAVNFAKKQKVKTYITANIFPRENELNEIASYFSFLNTEVKPDALIIADPGVLSLAAEYAPDIDIHLSTQANTTNSGTINFFRQFGVTRVNLARELTVEEISEIRKNTDSELEVFVHGAMCISYSGRCLLSSFMSGRSANHGECSHPCRWKYSVQEELRPNEYYPVSEDEKGTYIFNSKDLCMISHIDKLIESGVDSLKIEGRMKGLFYLGAVVKVYREAIDSYFENQDFSPDPLWTELLSKVSNRRYCTGFYLNDPDSTAANTENIKPDNVHNFLGNITDIIDDSIIVNVKNRFRTDDFIRILSPGKPAEHFRINSIFDEKNNRVETARPNTVLKIDIGKNSFTAGDMVFKE